jgi:hypothetical protein
MIDMQRVKPKALLVDGWVPLGRLGVRRMARVVVMAYGTRLLTAALYADEYLIVQIKGTVG